MQEFWEKVITASNDIKSSLQLQHSQTQHTLNVLNYVQIDFYSICSLEAYPFQYAH